MTGMRDPRLRCYMNVQALNGLPQRDDSPIQAIRAAGYDGLQFIQPVEYDLKAEAVRVGLGICGSGRVNTPAEVAPLAQRARDEGFECLTLHMGWGTEDDDDAALLIDAVIETSMKCALPLYAETHRATIFQDPWRTLGFLRRFPELEFNGDFSHWYTGAEMVYGGFENKMDFIRPVLAHIGFLHGRIGNPCSMQVNVGDGTSEGRPFVSHFRAMWTESFLGFLRRRAAPERICFTSELLGPEIYYARTFEGREESDRWNQSLVLVRIAEECFAEARLRWKEQT